MSDETLTMPRELIGVTAAEFAYFDRVAPDVHFTLPAHPTVKQQLEYFSRYHATRDEPIYLRLWHSAVILIGDWQCAALPDPKVDLNQITNADATTAVMWAGNLVLQYINDLETLPKA